MVAATGVAPAAAAAVGLWTAGSSVHRLPASAGGAMQVVQQQQQQQQRQGERQLQQQQQQRTVAGQPGVRQRKWGSAARPAGQRGAAQQKGSVWNCWSNAGLLQQ
ncbi:hypothetical protein OEZ86_001684 [Tetradesmus obliquus]|nr:hypothetical protein OEZ86_001684 [Tetradesmus obliquus]